LAHMLISTYFKPNIHQNGPEISRVKVKEGRDHVEFGTPMWYHIFTLKLSKTSTQL
jgi:hypothetical protein